MLTESKLPCMHSVCFATRPGRRLPLLSHLLRMKCKQRVAGLLSVTVLSCCCILFHLMHTLDDAQAEFIFRLRSSSPVNQTLHVEIFSAPLESLILHSPPDFKPQLLILIPSVAFNFEERGRVRREWANPAKSQAIRNGTAEVVFLIGKVPWDNARASIIESDIHIESRLHEDVLQVDVEESYPNLVHKLSVGFLWATSADGPMPKHIIKLDTDVAINPDRFIDEIPMLEHDNGSAVLWCRVIDSLRVDRDLASKWFVQASSYPWSRFPRFCSGPTYIGRRETYEKIIRSAADKQVISPEDAFFTGIVAEGVGVERKCGSSLISFQKSTISACPESQATLSIASSDHDEELKIP